MWLSAQNVPTARQIPNIRQETNKQTVSLCETQLTFFWNESQHFKPQETDNPQSVRRKCSLTKEKILLHPK